MTKVEFHAILDANVHMFFSLCVTACDEVYFDYNTGKPRIQKAEDEVEDVNIFLCKLKAVPKRNRGRTPFPKPSVVICPLLKGSLKQRTDETEEGFYTRVRVTEAKWKNWLSDWRVIVLQDVSDTGMLPNERG